MTQTIDSKEIMVPGDVFSLYQSDLMHILSPMCQAIAINRTRVECKVLRIYVRKSWNIYYVCSSVNALNREFVISQILTDFYQVTLKSKEFIPSAAILTQAQAELRIRPVGEFLKGCYLKDDAEKLANYIEQMPLKEQYGYLVPKAW